jgi:hypothetical protein
MLRPESLHLADPSEAPAGSLRGRALQTAFLGSHVRVAVGCEAADAPLTVALQGTAARLPEPDTEVALWWAPEDGVLLRRQDATGPA